MSVLIDGVPIANMAFQSSSNVNITGGTITGISIPASPPLITFASLTANGTTQATARALTANVNLISSVNANSGVIITATTGNIQYIVHRGGANTLNIFPPTSAQIEQQTINTPILLANGYSVGILVSSSVQTYAVIGGPSYFGLT